MSMKLKKCTVLVCSSDTYEDTWYPFFKLFHEYWPECEYKIILNTESKRYNYEGLDIQCYQFYNKNEKPSYGERIIKHLKMIDTPYTLILMDDFFIRKKVNQFEIDKVIKWLDNDKDAIVFSFQNVKDELNICSKKYPSYAKRPIYGEYKLNFQAAVWKTEKLLKLWKKHETPWEWETIGNIRSFEKNLIFYVLEDKNINPIDYGFDVNGMGIFRGKWVINTVEKLFRDHKIEIDYSIRGVYKQENKNIIRMIPKTNIFYREIRFLKSVGIKMFLKIELWRIIRFIKKKMKKPVATDYISYKREKENLEINKNL